MASGRVVTLIGLSSTFGLDYSDDDGSTWTQRAGTFTFSYNLGHTYAFDDTLHIRRFADLFTRVMDTSTLTLSAEQSFTPGRLGPARETGDDLVMVESDTSGPPNTHTVYRSTDLGATWTIVTAATVTNNETVASIVETSSSTVIIFTNLDVYRLNHGATTWTLIAQAADVPHLGGLDTLLEGFHRTPGGAGSWANIGLETPDLTTNIVYLGTVHHLTCLTGLEPQWVLGLTAEASNATGGWVMA